MHTLATYFGPRQAFYIHIGLIFAAYMSALTIALCENWGCVSILITGFEGMNITHAPSASVETVYSNVKSLYIKFMMLLILGILLTNTGAGEYIIINVVAWGGDYL